MPTIINTFGHDLDTEDLLRTVFQDAELAIAAPSTDHGKSIITTDAIYFKYKDLPGYMVVDVKNKDIFRTDDSQVKIESEVTQDDLLELIVSMEGRYKK